MKYCSPFTHPQASQDVGDFFYSVKVSKEGFHLKPWFSLTRKKQVNGRYHFESKKSIYRQHKSNTSGSRRYIEVL